MVELRQRRSEESPAAARRMDAALAGILREPAMKPELQRNAQDNTLRVWAAVSGAALENTKAERALLKRKGRVGGLEISAVGSLRLTNPTTGTFLREICPLNDGEWAVPGAPVLEAEAFGPLLTAALCPLPAARCRSLFRSQTAPGWSMPPVIQLLRYLLDPGH